MAVTLILSLITTFLATLTSAQISAARNTLVGRQSDGFPSFIRRAFHGSYILSNGRTRTLYVDGGEERYSNVSKQVVNNYTLTIDLSSSFLTSATNNHLIPRSIDKRGAPTFDRPHMWVDNNTVYAYGGEWSWDNLYDEITDIPLDALWAFSATGSGGTWINKANTKDNTWNSLVRADGGSSTYAEGIGAWHLGGRATKRTDQKTFMDDNFGYSATPGIQFFNYTDKSWANHSSSGFRRDGTSYLGQMQHVPNWGKYGLIVAIGGQPVKTGSKLFDMSNITVWDPATHTWYSQTAKGATGNDIPPQRTSFCAVGASNNITGTYEIFVYGGEYSSDATSNGTDYVWILSLPAFQWFRAEASTSERRAYHTCHPINRQLLSVGGLDPSISTLWDVRYNNTDPYTEGLKVFDMTALKWTNFFDANAQPYVTPDMIKEFYDGQKDSDGDVYPDWNNNDLKNIFTTQKAAITSTGAGGSTSFAPSPNSASDSSSPNSSSNPSTSTVSGGIIAGAVVGSLAGVALIGAAAFFSLRRKRTLPKGNESEEALDSSLRTTKYPDPHHNAVEAHSHSIDLPPVYLKTELPTEKENIVSYGQPRPRAELPAPQSQDNKGRDSRLPVRAYGARAELP